MGVTLVGRGNPTFHDLSKLAPLIVPRRHAVEINEGGEYWPTTPALAAFLRGGGVFIDYTGWPGWWAPDRPDSGENFAHLLVLLGIDPPPFAMYGTDPYVFFSRISATGGPTHGFDRALHLTVPITTLPGWTDSPHTPSWQDLGPDGKPVYGYSSFAFRAGRGLYVYVSATNYGTITFGQIADFVNWQVAALPARFPWLWVGGGAAAAAGVGLLVGRARRRRRGR